MFAKLFCIPFYVFFFVSKLKLCVGDVEAPIVHVKQGQIQGIRDKALNGAEFFSYMSIPYALPPEGNLRFKDPVPMKSWNGVLNGTMMPVACMQTSFFPLNYKDGITSCVYGREDCLYLNVFTPAPNDPEKNLPVMVYIHGGGFVGGKADFQPYVLMNEKIVLVVIQYRLGIFGFLSTEDSVLPGNMGLKDQQLALKWVKGNIKFFGGNSNMITIFGQSAGGASVHYQILSQGSKDLFNRAILQSGTSLCPWASNKNHRKFAIETGKEFNCSIDFGTEEYLKCMQTVHPYYLIIAGAKTNIWGLSPLYILPRVDGEFIDEDPEILMKTGKYNKVDIIAGITRDEGGLDLTYEYRIHNRRENFNKNFEKFGPISLFFEDEENALNLTKQVYQYYLKRVNFTVADEDWEEIVDMNSDRMFKICHDIVANFFAIDPDVKLYTYELDHVGQVSVASDIPGFADKKIITHADDMVYLSYDGKSLRLKLENEDDLRVREIFLNLWTNFAKTGNPTPSGSNFTWNEATTKTFRHLSLTPTPMMKEDNFKAKREFWSSLKTSQNMLLQSTSK